MAAGNTATLVVDGFIGAGIVLQAKTFTNVATFAIDVVNGLLIMTDTADKVTRVSLGAVATMVVAIAGGNYTVTIAD